MFHVSDVMKVHAGEKIFGVFRAHPIALLARLSGYAVCIIVPCFFVFPLFKAGPFGIAFFLLVFLIGAIGAWRAVRLWDSTALILTDRRLVHVWQRGMWDRQVAEVAFSHVGDVQWEKRGIWSSMWSMGVLRIRTNAGSVPSIAMEHVRHPDRLAHSIQELRGHSAEVEPHTEKPTALGAQRERLIHRINQADAETLDRWEGAMRESV